MKITQETNPAEILEKLQKESGKSKYKISQESNSHKSDFGMALTNKKNIGLLRFAKYLNVFGYELLIKKKDGK